MSGGPPDDEMEQVPLADMGTSGHISPVPYGHEDEEDPVPPTVPNLQPKELPTGRLGPKVGFALDATAAAARFTADMLPKQQSVQGRMAKKVSRSMQRLRDVDMNDEWPEAVARANHIVDTANRDFKDDAQELLQEASEDVLRRFNSRLEDVKDKIIEDHSKKAASAFSTARLAADVLNRDTQKVQILCLSFWVLFLVAWELLMFVISRPEDCRVHENNHNGKDVLRCYNVDDLLLNLECSNYKCAVPWSNDPGDQRCSDCNCDGICNHCLQCLCTVGFGPGQHQICMDFNTWPGSWSTTVRWVIVGFWVALFCLFALRYLVVWYTSYRSDVVLLDKDRRIAIETLKQNRKLQHERDEIMGTRVEFFDPPGGLYHADLVKAAVLQRMEERMVYRLPREDRVPEKMGEGLDAFVGVLSEKLADVKEHCTSVANPELHELYSTARQRVEVHNERVRRARKERQVGTTLSSLMVNLGDPWLKEVENGDVVPNSGELYTLYHRVADQHPGGPTPELLVKEMFNAKGIHASLPFLRKFLLREPARNELPITWREFYSEVCLAKDFIHQIRRGGADFGQYLTRTTDGLWGRQDAKDRPSQASALLEIAKQLAPLFSGDDDSDDEGSEDTDKSVDMKEIAAGTAPYALPLLRGKPIPTASEARKQKKALLQALQVLKGMMEDTLSDEDDDDDDDDDDDGVRILRGASHTTDGDPEETAGVEAAAATTVPALPQDP